MQFVINSGLQFPYTTPLILSEKDRLSGKLREFDDKISNAYLSINSCGFTIDECISLNTRRPAGRWDYQLIYLQEGSFNFQTADGTRTLDSGDILLYHPYEMQIYTSPPTAIKMYFIHFSGTSAEEILKSAGLTKSGKYHIGTKVDIIPIFNKIIDEFKTKQSGFELFCNSYFLEILAQISRTLIKKSMQSSPHKFEKIIATINYMNSVPNDMSTVREYAERANLTPCYFITLFKEYTGKSPLAYRTDIKIRQAVALLNTTQISTNELADFLGYGDPLYFSRLFKKHVGISPSNFRKEHPV